MVNVATVTLCLLVSTIGCDLRKPAATAKRNLVVINVDTLRADHLGCYGYGRDTSPFIDRLAAEGIRFPVARANSSFTRESVAALLTGRLPSQSGAVGWDAKPPAGDRNLGRIFERAGYATAFIDATTVLTDPRFTQGFQTVHHLTDVWGVSGLGPKLSAEAVAFAKSVGNRPFLMYLHYLDPHGPYQPTESHYRKLAPAPVPSPLNLYSDVRPHLTELVASGFGPGEERFEDQVARYDAEIADTDDAIAALFAGLAELGVLERTIVVVTADHGEEFLDHGFVEHAWTLYDEVLRIPLVLWPARAFPPLRTERRASTVDILPTLLDVLAVAARPDDLDGTSLRDDAQHPVVSELLIPERSVLRAVIDDRWKYVAAQKWLPPDSRPAAARVENQLRAHGGDRSIDPCGPVMREELYDLVGDPHEQRNVAATTPEPLELLRAELAPAIAACRARSAVAGEAPSGPSEEDRQRLRALGYVE